MGNENVNTRQAVTGTTEQVAECAKTLQVNVLGLDAGFLTARPDVVPVVQDPTSEVVPR